MDYVIIHSSMVKRKACRGDLMTILRGCGDNWKMRLASKVGDKERMWVLSGRSEGFGENDGDMPVNRDSTSLGHGTGRIRLGIITDLGLSRCARDHIRLVDMSNSEPQEAAMTNMETSAEILSSIDALAERAGEMRFYHANNGIIVSRGFSGTIPFASLHRSLISGRGGGVYAKDGNPQRAFQMEEKQKNDEDTASKKSSIKEVAIITTPDESGEEMRSPSESQESRRSAASKRSAAPNACPARRKETVPPL